MVFFLIFLFIFKNPIKTTFTYSLKIVLYFILFLKIVSRVHRLNSVRNFLKKIFVFRNGKSVLNCMNKQILIF